MPLYNARGNINVTVNDTSMPFGIYAADGSLRIKVVSGSTLVGLYAPDGAFNVVSVSTGGTPSGVYHTSGALRAIAATSETGPRAPNGALYLAGLTTAASLSADTGVYVYTGSVAGILHSKVLSAATAAYSLSGTAATLTYFDGYLTINFTNLTFAEDAQPYTITGGETISVSDDNDTLGADYELTLAISNGDLTLSGTTGLTFSTGDGTADSTMTFTGTIININTAIAGMQINNCTVGAPTLTIPFTNETTSESKSRIIQLTVTPAVPSGAFYYGVTTEYLEYDNEYVTYG